MSPNIRALAVELGRIMGDREIDLQDTAVADAAWIERYPDCFRVPGLVGANHLVMRGLCAAPGITRDGTDDALDVLEDPLDAPEASAGQDRDLGCRLRACRFVKDGRRDRAHALGYRRQTSQREAAGQQHCGKSQYRG